MEPQAKLDELKQTRDKLSRKKAAADERVRSAKEQYSKAVDKLTALGIKDVKTIPAKLKKYKADAEMLVADIEEKIPEAYQSE